MVSQVLFGETFTILDTSRSGSYSWIRMDFDGYEGWIDSRTITYLDDPAYSRYTLSETFVLKKDIRIVSRTPGLSVLKAGAGSSIVPEKGILQYGPDSYDLPGDIFTVPGADQRTALRTNCLHFLSVPYLWGGRSDTGIDCSGLVQNLFKQEGIALPRDAAQQANEGVIIGSLQDARPGDLAFFESTSGMIVHTGILLENQQIIHASGRVRIDRIDEQGIISEETGLYSHKLRLLKNVIG